MPKKKAAKPYFSPENAASLVQGEECRLCTRLGKPGLSEERRSELIAEVEKVTSFEKGLEVIADAL